MRPIHINMPDELVSRLDERARRELRDRSSAIRFAIELWLATPSQLPATPPSTTTEQDPQP